MSSFVFVLRQNPGLSWLVYSESPVGQKLCIIKDLQIFHKLNQFVALVNPYLVLPRLREPRKTRYFTQSQTVSVAWAHGMVSS